MGQEDTHSRSRSPRREAKRHRRQSRSPQPLPPRTKPLPLGARELRKHDLQAYRPMFALYLDIQKQKDIDELDDSEVKGRWKSFLNKWNRGDLAEGWYDPSTLQKAVNAPAATKPRQAPHHEDQARHGKDAHQHHHRRRHEVNENEDEDEDDYGPAPPSTLAIASSGQSIGTHSKAGPTIPHTSDLAALREEAAEDAATAQSSSLATLRTDRKAERHLQTQRLDELAPRAEPGTRERQLEKRREAAASNRSFAQAAHDSGEVEMADADVMGEADSLGALKKMKRENERKKNERELRREENLRARRAEWEEKMAVHRRREEKTMEGLRALAKARFGGGGGGEGVAGDTGEGEGDG